MFDIRPSFFFLLLLLFFIYLYLHMYFCISVYLLYIYSSKPLSSIHSPLQPCIETQMNWNISACLSNPYSPSSESWVSKSYSSILSLYIYICLPTIFFPPSPLSLSLSLTLSHSLSLSLPPSLTFQVSTSQHSFPSSPPLVSSPSPSSVNRSDPMIIISAPLQMPSLPLQPSLLIWALLSTLLFLPLPLPPPLLLLLLAQRLLLAMKKLKRIQSHRIYSTHPFLVSLYFFYSSFFDILSFFFKQT